MTVTSPIVDRTINLTRSLRVAANAMMDRAHEQRTAGQLSLNDYFAIADRYQSIINQANMVVYEAAEKLPPIEPHLAPLEAASKELEQAALTMAKVTDVLAVSAQLLQALSSLVVAILHPEPAAFAAVAAAIVSAVQGIRGQLSH